MNQGLKSTTCGHRPIGAAASHARAFSTEPGQAIIGKCHAPFYDNALRAALAFAAMVWVLGLLVNAAAAEADACPNAAIRQQQSSAYLPECRAYEIVNPPTRDLGDVNRAPVIADDGEHASYTTMVAPDGARGAALASVLVARRTSSGWLSTDANASSRRDIWNTMLYGPVTFSSDFSEQLNFSNVQIDPNDIDITTDLYRVEVGTGAYTWLTPGLTLPDDVGGTALAMGASPDLSRVAFSMQNQSLAPGAPAQAIYSTDGNGVDLVSTLPSGEAAAGPWPGGFAFSRGLGDPRTDGSFVAHGGQHPTSDDGLRIFFYDGPGVSYPLYVHDHGTSVAVSASERASDLGEVRPATFISGSHDGSTAYFVSSDQLTEDAAPGGGIYRFDVPARDVALLTPDPINPSGLELSSAISSDDQSHIYFTSTSALAGDAVAGDVNAYVWTEAEGTRFVAKVDGQSRFARVSRDGRFALLLGTASIDGAPNDGHQAVYEYDYETNDVSCASCRLGGTPSQGDANLDEQSFGFPAPTFTAPRNITDDGKVIFATEDRLVAADQTSAADVYVYDKGAVSLISAGRGEDDAYVADNSDDGRDIFFMTRSALVAADGDPSELDLYDARGGGGFLEPPRPAAPCEGEACRTQTSSPPAAASPSTPSFFGPGNRKRCPKGKTRRNGRCVAPRKSHKHKGKKHSDHKSGKRNANANGRTGR